MSTPATDRKAGPYSGNDSQTEFPFSFRVFAAANIQVIVSLSGVEHSLVLDTDYSISLNVDQSITPGGVVTYPLSGSPLAVGDTLAIIGSLDYAQTLTLPSGGNFSPSAIETALDRTVMLTQQLKEEVGRTVKVSVTSGISPDALLSQMAEDVAAAAASAGAAEAAAGSAVVDVQGALNDEVEAAQAARAGAETAAGTAATDAASGVSTLLAGYVADAMDAVVLAEEARDATLAAFDSFDDRYLGAKAVPPTTDNDGDPLQAGALYFDSAAGAMKLWTGSAWVSAYVQGGDFIEKDRAWPIGSIYVNAANATNPALLLGFGTWNAIGQGRVLVGVGTGTDANSESRTFAAAKTGGEYTHSLGESEMPSHTHTGTTASAGAHAHTLTCDTGGMNSGNSVSPADRGTGSKTTSTAGAHTHTLTINSTGEGAAHNNVSPYLAVYMWVRMA